MNSSQKARSKDNMPVYYALNDSLEAEKIYCVFEKRPKTPILVATKGRHNAQALMIQGNPAIAVIHKELRRGKNWSSIPRS
jgi:hypothetical protein